MQTEEEMMRGNKTGAEQADQTEETSGTNLTRLLVKSGIMVESDSEYIDYSLTEMKRFFKRQKA